MKDSIIILCGGGPAPGMNTVVMSVAKTFLNNGFRVIGLHGGYSGLFCTSPRTEEIDIWISINDLHLSADPVLEPYVIRIKECYPVAGSFGQSHIAGRRYAPVLFLIELYGHPGIIFDISSDQLGGIVLRTIIYYKYLRYQVKPGLVPDRIKGIDYRISAVIDWDNY